MQTRLSKTNAEFKHSSYISDHQPVIHNGVLFWNIMMQGDFLSNGRGINNGYGIIESDNQYQMRLKKIAEAIAEIIRCYPEIKIISLCEGPIKTTDQQQMMTTFKQYKHMTRFIVNEQFYAANFKGYPNRGLLMLADKVYKVSALPLDFIQNNEIFTNLINRLHFWKLNQDGKESYLMLAHFPFGKDYLISDKLNLSLDSKLYSKLIRKLLYLHQDKHLTVCADFNFNPFLIQRWQERILDKIPTNNSILLFGNKNEIQSVTVDGILLSAKAKQKYFISHSQSGLFAKLKLEHHLSVKYQNSLENKSSSRSARVACKQ